MNDLCSIFVSTLKDIINLSLILWFIILAFDAPKYVMSKFVSGYFVKPLASNNLFLRRAACALVSRQGVN